MSDTKHTPGPWKWEEGTPTITKEWNGAKVCVAQVKGADLHWHEDRRMASIEAGSNARLIAAAPELLASALRVQSFMDNYVKEGYESAMRRELRAAIAKATQP